MRTIVVASLLVAFSIGYAVAHEGAGQLSSWYRSLKQPESGVSCCSEQDCSPVDARLHEDHWEVATAGGWEEIPAEAVLKRENLDGRPVLCRSPSSGKILCFVPPAGA